MCYNLVSKCILCDRYIDSVVRECLANASQLNIHNFPIRRCNTTQTIDGFPLGSPAGFEWPVVDVGLDKPCYLRMHEVRTITAICVWCKATDPEAEGPDSRYEDECNRVHLIDFSGGPLVFLGRWKAIPKSTLTRDKNDTDRYMILFNPMQLDAYFGTQRSGRKPKIDASQEYTEEAAFPFFQHRVKGDACDTSLSLEEVQHRNRWSYPLSQLRWYVHRERMAASGAHQPCMDPQTNCQTTQAQHMSMAGPQVQNSPVVPSPPVPMAAPQLQHSGDFLERISRHASQESMPSAPHNLSYGTSQSTSQLATPPTPWINQGNANPPYPVLEVAAERVNAEIAAAGGFEAYAASTYTEAQAHGIILAPDVKPPSGSPEDAIDLEARPVDHVTPIHTDGVQVPAVGTNQHLPTNGATTDAFPLDPQLLDVFDPVAAAEAYALQQNAVDMELGFIDTSAPVDGATANVIQEGAMPVEFNPVDPPAPADGASTTGVQENAVAPGQQIFDVTEELWTLLNSDARTLFP